MGADIPLAEAAKSLSVALLAGLLIGLDRERSDKQDDLPRMAGVRTFPLIALLGATTSLLVPRMGVVPLVLAFVSVAGLVGISYLRTSVRNVGATTEMAALITFVLGVLAGQGALLVAAAVGIVVAVLLVAKPRLQAFSAAVTEDEIHATLKLAVISAIVLPLLPDQGYGPYQALNPFKVWMVAVLISAVSFAGFVAMRLWGERKGLFVTAFVGALVSSTAVTMAMAARSRSDQTSPRAPAAGAVMASTIMCVRVFVLASVFGGQLVRHLWPPLAAMTVVGGVATLVLLRRRESRQDGSPTSIENPSRLLTALGFALIYAVVGVLVPFAKDLFGGKGVVVAAGLSAIADVDAIAITLAQQARAQFAQVLVVAIAVAAVMNTWIKGAIAVFAGRGAFRWQVGIPLAVMGVAGLATTFVLSQLLT